ncbi:ATP-dependent RNA helicase DHX8-like [Ornithodoros turicata]|uniref:ATP-dependent RNA helicase DHX8-like n=1 Tax=Ornithodoros turicata TaxID=34597 RepID=UPI003139CC8A
MAELQDLIQGFKDRLGHGEPQDEDVSAVKLSVSKYSRSQIERQREELPIFRYKDIIVETVRENQTLVLTGEPGSGKSTQIVQYLHEAGIAKGGTIGCTEPRRVAAMSLARRVADEVGCTLGSQVGYSIRFEDCSAPETAIKYMTDGMLLGEAVRDSLLESYSVIVLDEAHERSIPTDVLFGVVKGIAKRRLDLKIIVTSATIDVEKFSEYFFDAPIIKIPGTTFPVEIFYDNSDPPLDYYEASIQTALKVHRTQPKGDILVFLSGQEEIENACEKLEQESKWVVSALELMVLPIFSALPSEMQAKVFEETPEGYRKMVVATNVAETSITIDGVAYVVDSGVVKQKTYNVRTGIESLKVTRISQVQATQRAGRAGRTGPGITYRVYSEDAYNKMSPVQLPEILRNELSSTILQLKALGVHEITKFEFMDAPPPPSLRRGIRSLQLLQAVSDGEILTELGKEMSLYPVDPPHARMLIKSLELGCSEEILTICAMLSAQHIFSCPKGKRIQAREKHKQFQVPGSDHLTLLKVYHKWIEMQMCKHWCYENFIQYRRLREALSVRKQLHSVLERRNLNILSCHEDTDKVLQALCYGFCQNIAVRNPVVWLHHSPDQMTVVDLHKVFLHPSSVVPKDSEWVVYDRLLETKRPFIRCVSKVDPSWIPRNILDLQVRNFAALLSAMNQDLERESQHDEPVQSHAT